MSGPVTSIEILEFGCLLMAQRTKLSAFAGWMTDDHSEADRVVRQALAVVWRDRDSMLGADLTPRLYGLVREGLMGRSGRQASPETA